MLQNGYVTRFLAGLMLLGEIDRLEMCVAIFSYFHFISIFYLQILLKNDKLDKHVNGKKSFIKNVLVHKDECT